jgi:glycosyltransferase involved in cell wall biosynthesis
VRPGYVVTQGVRLSGHFRQAGYPVIAVSTSTNRYVRWMEIAGTLLRRGRDIDILVIHVYGGPSFVVEDTASLIGRAAGCRIVMLLHGGALPEFFSRFPTWCRRVLSRASAIVAPSAFLAREAERRGFTARVIPNVIDTSAYPYRQRRVLAPRLFWMRTFDPTYNPLMAVEVLRRVRERHPDATLVMGGQDKGLRAEVERSAAEAGLGQALSLPGFLDLAGKLCYAARSDIFVSTSHIDNMPVAVVEAGALGLPVVCTSVGGVPDLLTDGETGLLVPDGDAEAMARAVLRLLGDPDLAERLSRGGREMALRSAWESVRPQWEELFGELLRESRGDAEGRS